MPSKASYRLTMRQGPVPGKVIELVKDVIVIGRDVNNDIVINDAEVSRTHARLTAQTENYIIEDLASTNGVFLNGQRLTGPKLLRPGDMVGFGETVVVEFSALKDADSTVVKSSLASAAPPGPVITSGPLVEPGEAPPLPPSSSSAISGSFPVNPAPALSDSISMPVAPSAEKPAWQRDRRVWLVGGVCGCLTLCGCGGATFIAIYTALNPDWLRALGL